MNDASPTKELADKIVQDFLFLKKNCTDEEWQECWQGLLPYLKRLHLHAKRAAIKFGIPYHNPLFEKADDSPRPTKP